MTDLAFELLPWQQQVWTSGSRFNVVAAGRRSGKTRLAIYMLLYHALQLEKGHVWYVAPTQGAARDILWDELQHLGRGVITKAHINNLQVTLVNGAKITLKGADRPETLRGVSLKFLVLDEYATMKPETWDTILRPALADQMGPALFIGTPAGRNHFYDMFNYAGGVCGSGESGGKGHSQDPDWTAWHFTSHDNPFVPNEEIEAARRSMSTFAFEQEFCASFNVSGSEQFRDEWMRYSSLEDWRQKGDDAQYFIACDLAGFQELEKSSTPRLDDSAIAIVLAGTQGWYVEDIISGRWTLKETAEKIFNAVQEYKPVKVGIEKGISKQAVMSPLGDLMRRTGRFFRVEELTHGNQKKTDRIMWALQGRFEHGRITLPPDAEWLMKFLDQLFSFPNKMVHDDLVDALAYIDQLVSVIYEGHFEEDDWDPLDDITGF
jgi:predicted phage terminase large subunit-like protein